MYVEAPVRSLFPGVFADGANSDATVASVRTTLDRATEALRRLTAPSQWLRGDAFCLADIFAFYALDIAERVTRFVYYRLILDRAGLADWQVIVDALNTRRRVLAAFAPTAGESERE